LQIIVTVLMDRASSLGELPDCEAKDGKKAVAHSKNILLQDEELLYRAMDDRGARTLSLCIIVPLIPEVWKDAHNTSYRG
jgi:hypothetical protein